MTAPSPATRERRKDVLFVTDAELIDRLGVPSDVARDAIRMLDRNPRSGWPQKQTIWGNRRYWPAVKAFLDRTSGILRNDAARVATENPHRNGLPRRRTLRNTFTEGDPHDRPTARR